jgi:hypothetical protein
MEAFAFSATPVSSLISFVDANLPFLLGLRLRQGDAHGRANGDPAFAILSVF